MSDREKEKQLIERIINRDEQALFTLYRLYQKPLYTFVYRQLNDKIKAEEVTQDIFMDFIESLRDFHFQCSIKTFLFAIGKRKVIDVIRKKKIKRIFFSSMPSYVVESLATVMFDDTLEKKEVTAKIKKVLSHLPNDYRLVLRLKYVEGERVKEIADRLSLKMKATESLIFRARKAFIKVFTSLP